MSPKIPSKTIASTQKLRKTPMLDKYMKQKGKT